jgi:subtilisin family serine protease
MSATGSVQASSVDQSTAFFFPSFQWNMRVTQANKAWLTTPEGQNAKVYILDTGIDPDHTDLAGLVDLTKSVSFSATEPGDILDHESHGTFVSAIVTSNGIGVASVAPLARLVAVKVLDSTGTGSFGELISGIVYSANQHADVINMSLGAVVDVSDPDTRAAVRHLQAAITFARVNGSVLVAAAGNDTLNLATLPPQILSVPAELLGVISVGATAPVAQMHFDQLASYSDFGFHPANNGVQIFAPGGDLVLGGLINDLIISACSEFASFGCGPNDYLVGAGTSFAAPMVSGESAVLRSIVRPSLPGSIFNAACILAGTDNIGPSSIFGRGRMNVVKAANCAQGPGFSNR